MLQTPKICHDAYFAHICTKECIFTYILPNMSLIAHFLKCSEVIYLVLAVASTVETWNEADLLIRNKRGC